ncbi:MAG: LexA family transcriptional regulator [Clostridia bacterium]|jgi:transcriptional regulator with XRE-family HTH domain
MGRQELKNTDMLNAAGIPFAELIRENRRRKKMSQEELGALVSVRKNAVGAWEAGRSRPDISSVPVICDALDIPLNEFFGIPNDKEELSVPDEFRRRYASLTDYHRKIILRQMDTLIELQKPDLNPAKKRKLISVFMSDLSACAGPCAFLGESCGEKVWIEETPLTILADEIIRVSGDSMEPEFHDGDRVLVQHGAKIRPGDVAIFVCGDAGYIKVYQRDGLHSLNPRYPVMHFGEGDEVRCIGKVLGIIDDELFASEDELNDI